MKYALIITFAACFVLPMLWNLLRHVVLIGRQRKPSAVRSDPRPFTYWSKL